MLVVGWGNEKQGGISAYGKVSPISEAESGYFIEGSRQKKSERKYGGSLDVKVILCNVATRDFKHTSKMDFSVISPAWLILGACTQEG